MAPLNKARFVLDLDQDSWCAIHSSLVAHLYTYQGPMEEVQSVKDALEQLESMALHLEILTKDDLKEWRAVIIEQLE